MQFQEVNFENFRSFGQLPTDLTFDPQITFFCGKNHTGKSNFFKILNELKQHNVPENRRYLLDPVNWFNYEAGVDRPLKIRLKCKLNDEEYSYFCKKWLISSITDIIIENFNDIQHENLKILRKFLYNQEKLKSFMIQIFPQKECIFRLEFIRLSETEQDLNYSIEFNKIMMINTADGREFIQNIGNPYQSKYRETKTWKNYITQKIESILDINNDEMECTNFIKDLTNFREKFILKNFRIDDFFKKMFDTLSIFHSTRKILSNYYEPGSNQNLLNMNKFLAKRLSILIRNLDPFTNNWYKLNELHAYFESIYESLDITFGITSDKGKPFIQYFNRSENRIIYNFDSIGIGITSTLNLLYQLIIEENQILALDTPEYQMHPHSQRNLYNLIQEYVKKNNHQVIIITHSPYFMHPDDIFQLRLFNLIDGKSVISQVVMPKSEKDYYKLKRNFRIGNRDAIFADGLIFVEGPSEEWAFPYFFRSYGLDLDLNNLSLINLHGKGNFEVFWRFAHQLQKKFWFFFDNDILGVKAGEEITQELFLRSLICKNKFLFPWKIQSVINGIEYSEEMTPIEFHEELEHLRVLLEEVHIFILKDDFEGIFESNLFNKINFHGGKVEKSIQLIEYLQFHEEIQSLPENVYRYIKMIQEELHPDLFVNKLM